MKSKKKQKDNSAKSSWSLGKIEEILDKNVELAKREFDFLRAVSLITPEEEEAFRAAPIEANVLKKLPKKDRQEDEALKKLERERRHEANCACIRKFLEIGRELKKSDPESKLFNLSVGLLDYLDRIESDFYSLSECEWKRLDTKLGTYASLLRGEAEKRCKAPSSKQAEQVETKAKRKRPTKAEMANRNRAVAMAAAQIQAKYDRLPTVDEIVDITKYSRNQIYSTDAYKKEKIAKSPAKVSIEMTGSSVQSSEYYGDKSEEHGRAKKRSKSEQAELDARIDEQKDDDAKDERQHRLCLRQKRKTNNT